MSLQSHPPSAPESRVERCTAPHPIVPFLYFVGTVLVCAAVIYWFAVE